MPVSKIKDDECLKCKCSTCDTVDCDGTDCFECSTPITECGDYRQGLGKITEEHPDGPLSSPEITEMHRNGTLCERCGCHMGKPTGYLRLCEGCGGDQG